MEFVQGLMNSNAKLAKDALGNTPLHYAAEKYPEVLDTLLSTAQGVGKLSFLELLPIRSVYHNYN